MIIVQRGLAYELHRTLQGWYGTDSWRAIMPEQQSGKTQREGQTTEQWPVIPAANNTVKPMVGSPADNSEQTPTPLTPLSLDTILTAGDIERILKIIASL